uniref:Uncharacterized protein n=1 Tax=Anguilla anguilla TaxID=7936 RepID=A0A0E9XFB4_ANGAN
MLLHSSFKTSNKKQETFLLTTKQVVRAIFDMQYIVQIVFAMHDIYTGTTHDLS